MLGAISLAGMAEAGPEAIEMPENVSESGMMMGAMVMAKPSLAGGLPGAMAPPEGMTAVGMGLALDPNNPAGTMMGDVMQGMGKVEMGEAMANMTGMDVGTMDKLGMADMAAQTGLTPGMVASMGAAGMAGMDVSVGSMGSIAASVAPGTSIQNCKRCGFDQAHALDVFNSSNLSRIVLGAGIMRWTA